MNKKLMVIQFFVVSCLILTICLIGVRQKDFKLEALKDDIISASKKYISDNNIEIDLSNSFVIKINELVENDYLNNSDLESYCIDEIVIFNGILQDEYRIINNCKKSEE